MELVLAQLVWVADNGVDPLLLHPQWAELVLAQPPLEQGRQRPAELVHELAQTEPPAELVQGPLLLHPQWAELVLAKPPLEQGRQWPASLVHELALKELPAELVLELVLTQPPLKQVQLVWVEDNGAHVVLLSRQWPA